MFSLFGVLCWGHLHLVFLGSSKNVIYRKRQRERQRKRKHGRKRKRQRERQRGRQRELERKRQRERKGKRRVPTSKACFFKKAYFYMIT